MRCVKPPGPRKAGRPGPAALRSAPPVPATQAPAHDRSGPTRRSRHRDLRQRRLQPARPHRAARCRGRRDRARLRRAAAGADLRRPGLPGHRLRHRRRQGRRAERRALLHPPHPGRDHRAAQRHRAVRRDHRLRPPGGDGRDPALRADPAGQRPGAGHDLRGPDRRGGRRAAAPGPARDPGIDDLSRHHGRAAAADPGARRPQLGPRLLPGLLAGARGPRQPGLLHRAHSQGGRRRRRGRAPARQGALRPGPRQVPRLAAPPHHRRSPREPRSAAAGRARARARARR